MKKIELTKRQKNNFLRKNRNSKDVTGYKTYIGLVFKDDKENFFLRKRKNFIFIGKNISKIEIAEDNSKRRIFKIYNQEGFYILYNKITEKFSDRMFSIEKIEVIENVENLLFIITKKGNKYLLEKGEMSILERKLHMDMAPIEYNKKLNLLTLYSKKENKYIVYSISTKDGICYYEKKKINSEVYLIRENQIKHNKNDIGSTIIDFKTMKSITVVSYRSFIKSINKFSENLYYLEIKNAENQNIKLNYTLFDIENMEEKSLNYGYIDDYDKRNFLGKDKMYTYVLLSNSRNRNKKFLKIKENLYFEEGFLGKEILDIGKLKRNIFGKVKIKCFSTSGSYAIFNFNKMELSNWKF